MGAAPNVHHPTAPATHLGADHLSPHGASEGTSWDRRKRGELACDPVPRIQGSQGGDSLPSLSHGGPACGAESHAGPTLACYIPPRPPCPHATAANSSRKHILR